MKLLVTRELPQKVIEALMSKFEITVRADTDPLTEAEATQALQDYDAVLPTLGDGFSEAAFKAAENIRCKILANFGVGYNHINAAAAADHGVAVSNTPGAVTDATADIAMTILLMTARRAGEGERIVRRGEWVGWSPVQMLGAHVTGKTVAIIGLGRIGKAIAKRCHMGFGMDVVFFNRSRVADPGIPARQIDTLHETLAAADFVIVAVPGSTETYHLIDADCFTAMKPTGIFVNISRGDVVDEPALIAALQNGDIAAAGLDVYEAEPFVPEALRVMENVTLLPHLGTAALDVRENMGMMTYENILAVSEGRKAPNQVN